MANSIPFSRGRLQRGEAGATGLGQRRPRPPFAEPHHVDRRRRQDVLKLCWLCSRLCRLRWGGNENPVVARPWEVTYDCHNSRPSRSAAPLRLDQRGSCPAGSMLSRAGSIPGKGQTPREPRAKRPARHRHDREDPPGGRTNGKCRAAPVGARGTPALPAALPGRQGETLTDPGLVPPSPPVVRGVHCPRCGAHRSRVVYTRPKQAAIIRRRECSNCGAKFVTWERIED
jgi:hypothetical protein